MRMPRTRIYSFSYLWPQEISNSCFILDQVDFLRYKVHAYVQNVSAVFSKKFNTKFITNNLTKSFWSLNILSRKHWTVLKIWVENLMLGTFKQYLFFCEFILGGTTTESMAWKLDWRYNYVSHFSIIWYVCLRLTWFGSWTFNLRVLFRHKTSKRLFHTQKNCQKGKAGIASRVDCLKWNSRL